MGKLEKFIMEHRKAFDDVQAPEKIWEHIAWTFDEEAHAQRSKRRLYIRTAASLAAMFILVCTAGILLYQTRYREANYSHINPALAQQQSEYVVMINEKLDALAPLSESNPKLYEEFSTVIKKMHGNYDQLKTELQQSPNKELTLEAMINNLKMQIEVLNQQLTILNSLQQPNRIIQDERI